MVKNWADHCSSDDEEDFVERIDQMDDDDEQDRPVHYDDSLDLDPNIPNIHLYQDEGNESSLTNYEDGSHHLREDALHSAAAKNVHRDYIFPSEPPFTAFIGNLAYTIKDVKTLAEKLVELVKEKLDLDLHVIEAKIIKGHNADRHRGFGYVQVETLDMLKELMRLNDKEATLAGRRIQLNTASQSNNNVVRKSRLYNRNDADTRQSNSSNRRLPYTDQNLKTYGDIDGTKFQGGRHSNKAVLKSSSEPAKDLQASGSSDAAVAVQRIPLNLKPRTKPLEPANVPLTTSEKESIEALPVSNAMKPTVSKETVNNNDHSDDKTDNNAPQVTVQQRSRASEGNQKYGTGHERGKFRGERGDRQGRSNGTVPFGKMQSRGGGGNDHRRSANLKSSNIMEEPVKKHGPNGRNQDSESEARGNESRFRNVGDRATYEGNSSVVTSTDRQNYSNRIPAKHGNKSSDRSLRRNKDAIVEKEPKTEKESRDSSQIKGSATVKKKAYSAVTETIKTDNIKNVMNSFAALESDSDSD